MVFTRTGLCYNEVAMPAGLYRQPVALLARLLTLVALLTSTRAAASRESCQPHGIHLSYGNCTQDMVLMWSSKANCTSRVEYGQTMWKKDHVAKETIAVFTEFNTQARHYYHHTVLQNLQANTTYYYSIVNSEVVSPAYYFRTPPNGTEWSPSFLLFGNLAVESDLHPVFTREAMSGQYSAFFHIGNFANDLETNGGQRGDQFMDIIQDYAKYVPYMTAPGNHEVAGETFTQYRHRFSMPGTSWPMTVDKLWYSINIGPVHFISYSTEVFFQNNTHNIATQSAWLIQDLVEANKNRHRQPWIIAAGHRPMYCSHSDDDDHNHHHGHHHHGEDCSTLNTTIRHHLEDILYIAGVDVIFESHARPYERLYPVYAGHVVGGSYINATAPIHIVSGIAGGKWSPHTMHSQSANLTQTNFTANDTMNMDNSTTIANTSTVNTTSTTSTANAGATTTTETTTTNTTNNNNNNNNNSKNNPGNWTAFRMNGTAVNTYGKFTVHNTTHMFWELLEKDNIVDSVWIVKDVHSKNNVSEKLKKKILKDIMDQLVTTTLKPAKTTASVPPVAGGGGGGGVDAKGGSRGGGGGGRGRAGKPSRGGGGGVNTHSSDGSVETLPFLTDNRRQTLIIVLSGVGGSMLILITIYVAVKSHRNRLKPLGAWNESKKSFYRNIQNLENDLGPEDDFSGNSSPTSKLLSDSMDM